MTKTSCRACGGYLTPTSHCTVCKEYITWMCNNCEKMEDVTHSHNFCRLPSVMEKEWEEKIVKEIF